MSSADTQFPADVMTVHPSFCLLLPVLSAEVIHPLHEVIQLGSYLLKGSFFKTYYFHNLIVYFHLILFPSCTAKQSRLTALSDTSDRRNKWHGCSNFLFPVQIKAVIITLQWICRRLTVCFIICHHVAWPVDSMTRLSKAAM